MPYYLIKEYNTVNTDKDETKLEQAEFTEISGARPNFYELQMRKGCVLLSSRPNPITAIIVLRSSKYPTQNQSAPYYLSGGGTEGPLFSTTYDQFVAGTLSSAVESDTPWDWLVYSGSEVYSDLGTFTYNIRSYNDSTVQSGRAELSNVVAANSYKAQYELLNGASWPYPTYPFDAATIKIITDLSGLDAGGVEVTDEARIVIGGTISMTSGQPWDTSGGYEDPLFHYYMQVQFSGLDSNGTEIATETANYHVFDNIGSGNITQSTYVAAGGHTWYYEDGMPELDDVIETQGLNVSDLAPTLIANASVETILVTNVYLSLKQKAYTVDAGQSYSAVRFVSPYTGIDYITLESPFLRILER